MAVRRRGSPSSARRGRRRVHALLRVRSILARRRRRASSDVARPVRAGEVVAGPTPAPSPAEVLPVPAGDRGAPVPTSPWSGVRAGLVHAYTATGAVLALLIVLAAVEGDVSTALWLGLAALVIDGTDGMLARRFAVKDRLPWFDGALLDNIVDYLTYVFAPVVLLLQGGYLPAGTAGTVVAALPLIASSYQFCRVDAKTDDHFFLGFPSYWNVVAFYAIAMDLSPAVVSVVVVVCALLVLVPVGYVYPSRMLEFRRLTLALSAVWLVTYAVVVAGLPDPDPVVLAVSGAYIVYYLGMSLFLEAKRRAARARPVPAPAESLS